MAEPTVDELAAEIERQLQGSGPAAPDPSTLTPPDFGEPSPTSPALQRLIERTSGGPVDATASPGLPFPDSDLEGAQMELFESQLRRFVDEGFDQPTAARLANEAVRKQFPITPEIPGTPTLRESTILALQPAMRRRDRRPLSEAERLERGFSAVGQGLATGVQALAPRSVREIRDDLLDSTVGFENLPFAGSDVGFETASETLGLNEYMGWDDRFPTGQDIGIRAENQTLWGLRVIGHGLVSAVQEFILKLPASNVPKVKGDWERAWVSGDTLPTLSEVTSALYGEDMANVGEVLLGLTPEERGQRIRRPGWWADWWQGVVEKIETGRGLETDFERGAREQLSFMGNRLPAATRALFGGDPSQMGPILAGRKDEEIGTAEEEWAALGWWVGFGLDIFVAWEKAPFKIGHAVDSVGRRANLARKMLPDRWPQELQTVVRAAASNEVDIGEYFGRRLGAEIEDGVIDASTIPPELMHHANAVAMTEFGMTFSELLRVSGLAVADAADPDVAMAAARASSTPPPDVPGPGTTAGGTAAGARPQPPNVRLESMTDFWDLVRGESFDIPRGAGYDRLRHLDHGAGPTAPDYVLRNGELDVVGTGTLQEMLDLIRRRGTQFGEFGDDIWFRNLRTVARWRTPRGRGSTPLAADYYFSSNAERALIQQAAFQIPRGVRGARTGPSLVRRTTSQAIADVVLRGPFKRAIETRDLGPVGQVMQEAARLHAREWIPTRNARFLANGVLAASSDVTRIHRQAIEVLEGAGLDEVKLAREVLQDRRALTEAEGRAITRLAERTGVDLDAVPFPGKVHGNIPIPSGPLAQARGVHRLLREGRFHPAHLRAVRNAVIAQVGGAIADTSYRLRSSPSLVDSLQTGLAFAWANLRSAPNLSRTLGVFGMPFERNVLDAMPAQARQVFDKWRIRLERTSAELGERLRTTINETRRQMPGGRLNPFSRVNTSRVLLDTLGDFAPARPMEVRLAREVVGAHHGENPMASLSLSQVKALSQRVYQAVRRTISYREFAQEFDWVGSSKRDVLEDGLRRWAVQVQDSAEHMAREYMLSVMAIATRADRSSNVADAIRGLPQDILLEVWREVFHQGVLSGDWLRHAWQAAELPVTDLPSRRLPLNVASRLEQGEAMFGYMLRELGQRNLQHALDELADEQVVFRPIGQRDPRRDVLLSTLQGTNTRIVTTPSGARSTQSRFSPALQTWANNQLVVWGLRAGSRQTTDVISSLRGGQVEIPEHLANEIRRALGIGETDASAVFEGALRQFSAGGAGRALDVLNRMWKQWTLGVFIVPKMAHYMGQMLGVLPILWTTRGLQGIADTAVTFGRYPVMVGELMQRVSAPDHWVFVPPLRAGRVFQATNGAVYHVDELAEAARAGGLGDTVFSIETMQGLRGMLANMDTGVMDPRRLVKAVSWWNQYLQEAAGTFDQVARMSVFLDEVQKGTPLAEAAIRARRGLLDYRALTEFDQRFMRLIFSFYAFMRKNGDAYIHALFRNPERVMQQMRVQHELAVQGQGLLNLFDDEEVEQLTPAELGAMREENIGRFILYSSDEVVNEKGRVHPRYRQNRWTSTPLGPAEWLNTMMLFTDREWRPGINRERFGDNLLPPWQSLMLATAGQQLGPDWKPDSFNANRIPPFLMQPPFNGRVVKWLKVGPMPLREGVDDPAMADPDATAALGGRPAVWAAGRQRGITTSEQEAAWSRWQQFRLWMSSPLGLSAQISRAAGATEPKSNVTHAQEWLQLVSGFRVQGIEDERTVIARERRDRTFQLREAARRADPDPQ